MRKQDRQTDRQSTDNRLATKSGRDGGRKGAKRGEGRRRIAGLAWAGPSGQLKRSSGDPAMGGRVGTAWKASCRVVAWWDGGACRIWGRAPQACSPSLAPFPPGQGRGPPPPHPLPLGCSRGHPVAAGQVKYPPNLRRSPTRAGSRVDAGLSSSLTIQCYMFGVRRPGGGHGSRWEVWRPRSSFGSSSILIPQPGLLLAARSPPRLLCPRPPGPCTFHQPSLHVPLPRLPSTPPRQASRCCAHDIAARLSLAESTQ